MQSKILPGGRTQIFAIGAIQICAEDHSSDIAGDSICGRTCARLQLIWPTFKATTNHIESNLKMAVKI
jgi:hypothetical protein